jgi:GTP cyclohydrolase I
MKTDVKLGEEVKSHLLKNKIETPLREYSFGSEIKKVKIENHFKNIMIELGLDLADDSLMDTPRRVSKMFVDEIFYGLDYANFPKITTVENKMQYDEMLIIKGCQVSSTCEHHFVVIDGLAKIAYIPKDKVIGLSKINRIVKFFSKRPQIQERLTEQIYAALQFILKTDSIAVEIDATHFCVKSRGVEDSGSSTVTRKLGGVFMTKPEVRNEFLNTK